MLLCILHQNNKAFHSVHVARKSAISLVNDISCLHRIRPSTMHEPENVGTTPSEMDLISHDMAVVDLSENYGAEYDGDN